LLRLLDIVKRSAAQVVENDNALDLFLPNEQINNMRADQTAAAGNKDCLVL
jgi:hypothetical protein